MTQNWAQPSGSTFRADLTFTPDTGQWFRRIGQGGAIIAGVLFVADIS